MTRLLVTEKKKHEFWNHFIARWTVDKEGGGYGVTGPQLRKIKPIVWGDNDFWQDVVVRHDGLRRTPEEMQHWESATYDHCLGNFWGMIYRSLMERKIIK